MYFNRFLYRGPSFHWKVLAIDPDPTKVADYTLGRTSSQTSSERSLDLLRGVSLPFEGLRAGLRVSLSRTLSPWFESPHRSTQKLSTGHPEPVEGSNRSNHRQTLSLSNVEAGVDYCRIGVDSQVPIHWGPITGGVKSTIRYAGL